MKAEFIKVDKSKIQNIINLLKFVLPLEDPEIMKSTVESIVEILQELQE